MPWTSSRRNKRRPRPPGEYKPKNGSVSGYCVNEAGLLPFPDDEQADVVSSLQFPPHCGGDWLRTNVGDFALGSGARRVAYSGGIPAVMP